MITAANGLQLDDATLEVGAVSDVVPVFDRELTGEQSAQVTTQQVQDLTARGRDIVSLLRTKSGAGYASQPDEHAACDTGVAPIHLLIDFRQRPARTTR